MTPICPRPTAWSFSTTPFAAATALVMVSIGFAQDGPTATHHGLPISSKTPQAVNSGQAGPNATMLLAPVATDVQISYVVCYLAFPEQPWRNRLKFRGRLTPWEKGAGARGWTIDHAGFSELCKHLTGEVQLFQSQKATFFDNSRGTFLPGSGDRAYFDYEGPPGGRWISSREIKEGSRIDLSGSATPRGVRLSVDLRDSMAVTGRDHQKGGTRTKTPDTSSTPGEFRFEGSSEVPSGSSLLVRLGSHERRVGSKLETIERLVIIKPSRILLEPEPRMPPSRGFPKGVRSSLELVNPGK